MKTLVSAAEDFDFDKLFKRIDEFKKELVTLEGTVPDLTSPPTGCRFHPRCEYANQKCSEKIPELIEIEPGHQVACFRASEINIKSPLGGANNS